MISNRRLGGILTLAGLLAFLAFGIAAQPDRNVIVAKPAEGRQALVIGNRDYKSGALANSLNDARAMAAMLEELGFAVDSHENAAHQSMEDAVRAFGKRLRAGGVGVFFYAGHAVQVDGENYLVPVGQKIEAEHEVRHKAVALGFLLGHMGEADNGLNIVILDACRDNPFRGFRTLGRGLAEAKAPAGTLIAYATAPGDVAADGEGEHSPFTEHLLASLERPGLQIEEVLKRTRVGVRGATGNRQVPWTASSLIGRFVPRPLKAAELAMQLPDRPRGEEFSLEDILGRAEEYEAIRKAWTKRLAEMKKAFAAAEDVDGRAVPAELKTEAWRRFLGTFGDDDPYSKEDEELRRRAGERVADLELIKSGKKALTRIELAPSRKRVAGELAWKDAELGMRFRYIPKGTFMMGSPEGEVDRDVDETLHEVTLTRDFLMGETEVTQKQWRTLMGTNPSHFKGCDECPVETVNWYEAVASANALSQRAGFEVCYELSGCENKAGDDMECATVSFEGLDCRGFRLPTEAEWEHAARAGTSTPFWTGENLTTDQANYDGNYPYASNPKGEYRQKTVTVRSFEANSWGLYEVHGNVWEWVWDWKAAYPAGTVEDPAGPSRGSDRVIRGGCWNCYARYCRAAFRYANAPGYRMRNVGFGS